MIYWGKWRSGVEAVEKGAVPSIDAVQPRVGLVELGIGRLDQQRNASGAEMRRQGFDQRRGQDRIAQRGLDHDQHFFSPFQRRARFGQRPGLDQTHGMTGVMG